MDKCDVSQTSSSRRPSTAAVGRYDKNLKCLEDDSELVNVADEVADPTPQIPPNLETISRLEHLPSQRHRWNTNEEIAGILINFPRHDRWLTSDVRTRPFSGSLLLYSRKKVRYRRDGYCWKKRRDGKTTREDHMKLKVQGIECIYGCYVHSAILPTFHRRCYWLLQNPDIVLVHYLNVPFPDDNKVVLASTLPLWAENKQWSREELCLQLRPMFSTDASGYSTETGVYSDTVLATVDVIVDQLLERQKLLHSSSSEQQPIGSTATPPVQYRCGCTDASCQPGTVCPNPVRRGSSTVVRQQQQSAAAPSTSAPANVNSAPQPPLLINVQRVGSGAGSYLLVHNGTLSSSSPPTAAAAISESSSCTPLHAPSTSTPTAVGWPPASGVSHDLFRGAFDLSLDDIQLTLSGSLTTSDMELNGLGHPCESAAAHPEDVSLLDAFDGLDNFDFKSLDVGRSSCSSPDSSESPDNRIQRTMEDVLPASSVVAAILPECTDPPAAVSASQVRQLQLAVASRPAADESEEDADAGLASPVKLEAQGSLPLDRQTAVQQRYAQQLGSCRDTTACISDFSPEWAYPEGGIKVLVAGPWYARSAPYIVLFDGVSVSTSFVQSGVLRCYCPAHEVGLVSLQVACDGLVISNACLFEYKRFPSEEAMADCSVPFPVQDDVLVKFTLMQRVRLMESQIDGATSSQASDPLASLCSADLEERLIGYCHTLMTRTWVSQSFSDLAMDSPSILHLAALLGYHRLVCALFRWRTENPFLCLEAEVDAVRTDASGDTPLSLACHRGHMETARLLYQWNHAALRVRNVAGCTPVDVARDSGHAQLADELQRLDATRQRARELERNERAAAAAVFARPTAKHRSELWRQRNFSLDLSSCSSSAADVSSGAAASSGSRPPRSCTPSPQRSATTAVGATSRRTPSTARSSVDSGLDTLRGERSSSVPTAAAAASSPACGSDTGCSSASLLSDPAADQQQHVLTLAEHIIAAIPERIKIESDNYQWDHGSSPMSDLASLRSETAMDESFEPLDIADFSYRCRDVNTPLSSVPSPASSSCLASPRSFSVSLEFPSPPPSAADLGQYFQASRRDVMLDFSNLTLTDREQRELYEAAIVIQKAYRIYKGRKRAEEQDREKQAAIVIQNGYRRYKQYCYYTQMTRAAMVIQTRYRSYCEHKRFKKSQEAAVCIQNYYRQYREHASKHRMAAQCAEASSSAGSAVGLKRTYSQRRQHLAAMKIQHFMRQSRNNRWDVWFDETTAERALFGSRKREAPAGSCGSGLHPPKVSAPATRCQQCCSSEHLSVHQHPTRHQC